MSGGSVWPVVVTAVLCTGLALFCGWPVLMFLASIIGGIFGSF